MPYLKWPRTPWVLVQTANLTRQNNGYIVRPVIQNLGKTIARIRKISLGGTKPRQISEKLEATPVYEGQYDFDFILCPEQEFPPEEVPFILVNGDNIAAIQGFVLKLYIYGVVEYLDLSGKERVTGFVLFYDPPRFLPYLGAPSNYYKAT